MKTPAIITAMLLAVTTLQARETTPKDAAKYGTGATQPYFIENKGQVTDQYGSPRRDIDYKLRSGDITLFAGDGQLHYQWSSAPKKSKSEKLNTKLPVNRKSPSGDLGVAVGTEITMYRMDVTLLGANKHAEVVAEEPQVCEEHYYRPYADAGTTVHSYSRVVYKNVYPHIDWVLYTPTPKSPEGDFVGGIKYDFIVHPGGNVADIQLQYNGATKLAIENGALVAATPMGSITEDAPYCYMAGSKEPVASHYVLEGNVLRYDVANTAANTTLIIDPALRWATYYGGTGDDWIYTLKTDTAGSVFINGRTNSTANIATTGAFQTVYAGGTNDAFVAKFSINGAMLWATYFGSSSTGDDMRNIATDETGNVYLGGTMASPGYATTGSYQPVLSGSADAFLVKFNGNGIRQWATYFGTDTTDGCRSITCDEAGNIYMSGGTGQSATMNLSTPGVFRTTYDQVFIAKFSPAGSRIWCSYFTENCMLHADKLGGLYLYGFTQFTSGIATTGAHQATIAGGGVATNSFIVKFATSSGTRLWGTYYGAGPSTGGSWDAIHDLKTDRNGIVYVCGRAIPTTNIPTTGAFQTTFGGGSSDGFLAKFSSAGVRQWATLYGSSIDDYLGSIAVDDKNDVYLVGSTYQAAAMYVTANALQSTFAGVQDLIIAKFDGNGARKYGSYFGSSGGELTTQASTLSPGYGFSAYCKGRLSVAGLTGVGSNVATSGAYQTSPSTGIGQEGFVVQFDVDTAVYINQPFADTVVCSGDTLSIPYGVTQNFRTANNFIFELSNATGSFASGVTTLGTLTAAQTGGVFNYVVPHSTTQSSLYRVRVRATAPLDTGTEVANIRITTTPQSPTATNNGPVCSGNPLNISSSSTTAGVTYSWSGPSGYTSTAQNPVRTPSLTKYSGDYIVTITNNGCISKDTTTAAVDSTPIAITAGNNGPLCVGSDLQLTATNSTLGATYHWSGPSFSNTTQNPTINNAGLANAGVYSVYASLGSCNTATVTTTVSVVNGPSVSIYPSPKDTICGNPTGSATFNASSTGGAGYQWYKNGSVIPGATGTTYAATGIQTGDVFYVKLTPGTGAACNTPVNSNHITMTVMPYVTPSVTITVSPDSTAWSGVMLTFTATATNAGNNPKYQWKVNGVSMVGATSSVWGAPNLNDKDKVTCEVTSSYICPQPQKVTSNVIGIKIKTGINNLAQNNISIYPNPTQTTLTVEGAANGTIIQLKDVLGRQVIHTTATQTKTVLNTAHIAAGNYLLVLTTTDGEVLTEKLVKE